jgi:hypothetical protein
VRIHAYIHLYIHAYIREHLRGKYHCTVDLLFDRFGLACFANKNKNCQLSSSWFQTSQTGGQLYSDTSPAYTYTHACMRYTYVALPLFTCAKYMLKYTCVHEHMCYAYMYITHRQTLDHTPSYVCVYIYIYIYIYVRVYICVCGVCVCKFTKTCNTRTLKPCNDEVVSIRFNYKGRLRAFPTQMNYNLLIFSWHYDAQHRRH